VLDRPLHPLHPAQQALIITLMSANCIDFLKACLTRIRFYHWSLSDPHSTLLVLSHYLNTFRVDGRRREDLAKFKASDFVTTSRRPCTAYLKSGQGPRSHRHVTAPVRTLIQRCSNMIHVSESSRSSVWFQCQYRTSPFHPPMDHMHDIVHSIFSEYHNRRIPSHVSGHDR
jgi:hypothetical protein